MDLYAWMTPNGFKITIALAELDLPYTLNPVNLNKGENKEIPFAALTPNQKIPVLVDPTPKRGGPLTLWESGAILMYLAEKQGALLPKSGISRAEVMQWLMFQVSGIGPCFGNAFHFQKATKGTRGQSSYATQRFVGEVKRMCGVLDQHLATQEYLSKGYSIADIATYPWIRSLYPLGVSLDPYLHLKRWYHMVDARPAVQKGMAVFKDLALDLGLLKSGKTSTGTKKAGQKKVPKQNPQTKSPQKRSS